VCGVAVKVERPQAKPRTNDLEGGVVRPAHAQRGCDILRVHPGFDRVHRPQAHRLE
jgi:hypothetical protein